MIGGYGVRKFDGGGPYICIEKSHSMSMHTNTYSLTSLLQTSQMWKPL